MKLSCQGKRERRQLIERCHYILEMGGAPVWSPAKLAEHPLNGSDHLIWGIILNVMSRSRNQDVFHAWFPGCCELIVHFEFQILLNWVTWESWVLLGSAEQNDRNRW